MPRKPFINHLKSFKILKDNDINQLIKISKEKRIKKGDFLIQEGKFCKEISFVNSGFFHSFYLSRSQEQITYCLTFPSNFITAFSSYLSDQKTQICIQALTDANLTTILKKDLKDLIKSNPRVQRFFNLITEEYLIKLENRFFQLQKDDAKNRYETLVKRHPELIKTMPLKLLASYLGITPRHLSRIRANNL